MSAQNEGIIRLNKKALDGECFKRLAVNFYDEINNMNKDLDFNVSSSPEDIINIAGIGKLKDLDPGWLFDSAMQYANNNHYLAMRLIGICGHDDKYQQGDDLLIDCPYSDDVFYSANALGDGISLPINSSNTHPAHKDIISYQELITTKFFSTPNAFRQISCTQNIAKKCSETEKNVNFETNNLWPKNYHYIGAALTTCELSARGVAPSTAINLESISALAYRTITSGNRLVSKVKALEEDLENLEELLSTTEMKATLGITEFSFITQSGDRMQDKILKLAKYYQQNCQKIDPENSEIDMSKDEEQITPCQKINKMNSMQWHFRLDELNDQVIKNKLAEYVSKKTFIKHSTNLNPFNTPTNTITEYMRAQTTGDPLFVRKNFKYEISDQDRSLYGDVISLIADKKIKSLLADYDWTTSQHLIGAEFGSLHCGDYSSDQLEKYSCDAKSIIEDQVIGNSMINDDSPSLILAPNNLSNKDDTVSPAHHK